jgi:hypothetical protein
MELENMVSVIAKLSMKRAELDAAVRRLSRRVSESSPPLKAIKQELSLVEWDLDNFQKAYAEAIHGNH